MQQADLMERRNALCQLAEGLPQPGFVEGGMEGAAPDSAHVVQEVLPFHQLHREVPGVVLRGQFAEAHQVGMDDVGQGTELPLEAEQHSRLGVPEHLERHALPALLVPGGVHHAKAPLAERLQELEPTDGLDGDLAGSVAGGGLQDDRCGGGRPASGPPPEDILADRLAQAAVGVGQERRMEM